MNTDKRYPFDNLIRLVQIFWHWATPFWLFRDVSCGTVEQRSANYRYNRAQREILPGYTVKWMAIAAFMMLQLQVYSGLLVQTMDGSLGYFCASLFCISTGIGFSFSCIVIAVLTVSYLFFTHIKE